MSFQRITIIGSMPSANSELTASRTSTSARFSSRWISLRAVEISDPLLNPFQRRLDLLGGGMQYLGERLGRLQRRLHAVAAELVGGLLGMVDHVVERHGEVMDVGAVHARSPATSHREPAQDLMGDPVALVLARAYLFAELARLGEHAEELPQQATRDVGVPAGLVEQGQQGRDLAADGGARAAP